MYHICIRVPKFLIATSDHEHTEKILLNSGWLDWHKTYFCHYIALSLVYDIQVPDGTRKFFIQYS